MGALATTVLPAEAVGDVAAGIGAGGLGVAGAVVCVGAAGVAGVRRRVPVERRRVAAECRALVRRRPVDVAVVRRPPAAVPPRAARAAVVRPRAATKVAVGLAAPRPLPWAPACLAARWRGRWCCAGAFSAVEAGDWAAAGGRPRGPAPIESATSPRTTTAAMPAAARRTVGERRILATGPTHPATLPAAAAAAAGGGVSAAAGCGSGAMAAGSSAGAGAAAGSGGAPPAPDPVDDPSLTIGS